MKVGQNTFKLNRALNPNDLLRGPSLYALNIVMRFHIFYCYEVGIMVKLQPHILGGKALCGDWGGACNPSSYTAAAASYCFRDLNTLHIP